jgi:oligogalacturonide lyase
MNIFRPTLLSTGLALLLYLYLPSIGICSPTEWTDPDTGHRVVQLSREPGSESLYFNLNPFTPDGKKMVITAPDGVFTINLETRQIEPVLKGRVGILMVGHKTGQVYYYRFTGRNPFAPQNHIIYATDLNTKATREVATLPPGEMVVSINSDETLLAGTITDISRITNRPPFRFDRNLSPEQQRERKGEMINRRFHERLPMKLFFLDLKTGNTTTCASGTDWLNHLQFSPTDPNLLLFCHEGPWQDVDRIWTIHSNGSDLTLVHQRTMVMEIAGHEFWGPDGQTVWYDLQTPRGEDFWVGGYNLQTKARTWYHLDRDEWSVHYNISPDGQMFCGDGGDDRMVAHATNGKWIYLFRPELVPVASGAMDKPGLIHAGVFHAERLVNMARHNYALEPNAMFSPDEKWIIFRSNMSGASQVYEVQIDKATSE